MSRRRVFHPRKSRAKGIVLSLLAALVALMLAWAVGFLVFIAHLPREVEDASRPTDAIVVLTGGSGRFDQGLDLLASGVAGELFVTGVHQDVRIEELLYLSPRAVSGQVDCCIALGHEAQTTYGNAQETAAWMHSQGYRSLRLVTAAYHMPRSLLEFRRAMPAIEIVAHPVFPDHVRQDDWWRWRNSARLLALEYTKYLGAQVRAYIPSF